MKTMQSLKDSFLAVLVLCAAGASAAPIDVWEPVKAGPNNLIPSASALRSTGLPTKWIGYSNGDIYWNGTQVNFSDIYSHDTLRGGVPTAIAAGGTWDDDWAVVSYTKYIGDPRNALYQIFVTHNGPSMMAFVPQGVAGEVLGVSANPANSDLLYLATTSGGYAGSRITKMFEHRSASDPLNVPSGQAISAAAQSASVDVAVVGTENGEVWSVSGIKAGHPTWTRIDRVGVSW